MKVLKFGGGCLKDAEAIRKLPGIIKNFNENIIIVVSAFGKLTNFLEKAYDTNNMQIVNECFISIMKNLSLPKQIIYEILSQVKYSDSKAELLSTGEIISSKILSCYLQKENFNHTLLNATQIIKTNYNGVNSSVNWEDTKSCFHKKNHALPLLTQGFIASYSNNENFEITCLGREGSDYSAAIFGKLFNADQVILFKDVDGIYSEDPKKNASAKLFETLTYDEAFNLCNKGNTVIHPKTIEPLREKGIPILIKNFNNLNIKGTLIS